MDVWAWCARQCSRQAALCLRSTSCLWGTSVCEVRPVFRGLGRARSLWCRPPGAGVWRGRRWRRWQSSAVGPRAHGTPVAPACGTGAGAGSHEVASVHFGGPAQRSVRARSDFGAGGGVEGMARMKSVLSAVPCMADKSPLNDTAWLAAAIVRRYGDWRQGQGHEAGPRRCRAGVDWSERTARRARTERGEQGRVGRRQTGPERVRRCPAGGAGRACARRVIRRGPGSGAQRGRRVEAARPTIGRWSPWCRYGSADR
jgi:hypothetical protein